MSKEDQQNFHEHKSIKNIDEIEKILIQYLIIIQELSEQKLIYLIKNDIGIPKYFTFEKNTEKRKLIGCESYLSFLYHEPLKDSPHEKKIIVSPPLKEFVKNNFLTTNEIKDRNLRYLQYILGVVVFLGFIVDGISTCYSVETSNKNNYLDEREIEHISPPDSLLIDTTLVNSPSPEN